MASYRVLVTANLRKREALRDVDAIADALRGRGMDVDRWDLDPIAATTERRDPGDCDLVVALGGDGFLMAVIRELDYRPPPIYGLNYGRVGFLMNPSTTPEQLAEIVAEHSYQTASYPVLDARLRLEDGTTIEDRAFNDFVIERASGQTAQLEVFIDGILLNNYSGDGLIVATPGGSTAYSLAAGGPVVHHSVDSMIITPLCPHRPVQFHSLQFSMLLALGTEIRIHNADPVKRPVRCVADGRAVERVTEVEIQHRGTRIHLLRGSGYDFVETLVRKVIGLKRS